MSVIRFATSYCDGTIRSDLGDAMDITVFGRINERVHGNVIRYAAASPPDYRATYTGSGLPFANEAQAFYNTPNSGYVTLIDNTFEVKLMYPNSYYVGLGTVIMPPTLYIYYQNTQGEERVVNVKISNGIPYRTLTYPKQRDSAVFYSKGWSLPVRTQEQVLRDSGYPATNTMPDDHWGLKPPM